MGLLNMFSRPEAEEEAQEPASARDRLRAAFAARKEAKRALVEAAAATQRVQDLIAAADVAEEQAKDAAKAAAEATRRWAVGGARGDVPSGDQALLDAAAEAQRHALHARLKADGAESALREVRATEAEARGKVEFAEKHIRESAMDVLLEEHLEADMRIVERAAAECAAPARRIAAALWLSLFADYRFPSVGKLRDRLRAARPVAMALTDLQEAETHIAGACAERLTADYAPLAEYVQRLRADPEAKAQ